MQAGERNFHSFYMMVQGAPPQLLNKLKLTNSIQNYRWDIFLNIAAHCPEMQTLKHHTKDAKLSITQPEIQM